MSLKNRKKILLGQLAARGDCLYATTIAKQIKKDYPTCHLTWAIGTMCSSLLINNPHVDEIWEIPLNSHEEVENAWFLFEKEAQDRQRRGVYDEIFLTQVYPNNFQNFDGTVRASIFRGYTQPITVPIAPVICLTQSEIDHVNDFAKKHRLQNYSKVILFECAAKSGQSFLTAEFALQVAKQLVQEFSDLAVILTSQQSVEATHPAIIDGRELSFRENAEITKYCHLFIGCSSGITWLCTSEWAKPLPMIQLLKKEQSVFASVVHDHRYFGLDHRHVIELTECSEKYLVACISTFFNKGFDQAYQQYHTEMDLNFDYYFSAIHHALQNSNQLEKYYTSIFHTFNRYGLAFIPHCYTHFKKDYIHFLEHQVNQLNSENILLKKTNEELSTIKGFSKHQFDEFIAKFKTNQ